MNPIRRILLCLALLVSGLAGITSTALPAQADHTYEGGAICWDWTYRCEHWDTVRFPVASTDFTQPCVVSVLLWCKAVHDAAAYTTESTKGIQFSPGTPGNCEPRRGYIVACIVPHNSPLLPLVDGEHADAATTLYHDGYFGNKAGRHTVAARVAVADKYASDPNAELHYRRLFRHEFGHIAGLGHRFNSPGSLMNSPLITSDTFDQHDLDALKELYDGHHGPPGGNTTQGLPGGTEADCWEYMNRPDSGGRSDGVCGGDV